MEFYLISACSSGPPRPRKERELASASRQYGQSRHKQVSDTIGCRLQPERVNRPTSQRIGFDPGWEKTNCSVGHAARAYASVSIRRPATCSTASQGRLDQLGALSMR